MKNLKFLAIAVLLLPSLAAAQKSNKHNEVPAVFGTAKTVFVESVDGPLDKPGLDPAEAQAINSVQGAILTWHRYDLAIHREKADLIFVLRKGQPGNSDQQPGLKGGSAAAGQSTMRVPGQSAQADNLGASAQAGPEGDSLRVYTLNEKGKLVGPVWTREIPNGLDPPSPLILDQLKIAIDRTFPLTTPPAAVK
jgi:hypothetical protein